MSKLAIAGGTPLCSQLMEWPVWPQSGPSDHKALIKALESPDWGGCGAEVAGF